jgi:hypothetical protein
MTFSPISLSHARDTFRHRFETCEATAFDYLESVESAHDVRQPETVSKLFQQEQIHAQLERFIEQAESNVIYIENVGELSQTLLATLSTSDAEVAIFTPHTCDRWSVCESLTEKLTTIDESALPSQFCRYLGVDEKHFLFSVQQAVGDSNKTGEVAIYAEDSRFMPIFRSIVESWPSRHSD